MGCKSLSVARPDFIFTGFLFLIPVMFCSSCLEVRVLNASNTCANLTVTRKEISTTITIPHHDSPIPEECKGKDYNISKIDLIEPNTVVRICGNLYHNCTAFDESGDISLHRITTTMVSHIMCYERNATCATRGSNCDSDPPKSDESDWGSDECARLYSDDNCNSCTFPPHSLYKNKNETLKFKGSIRINNNGCDVYGEYLEDDNSRNTTILHKNGNIPGKFEMFTCKCRGGKPSKTMRN